MVPLLLEVSAPLRYQSKHRGHSYEGMFVNPFLSRFSRGWGRRTVMLVTVMPVPHHQRSISVCGLVLSRVLLSRPRGACSPSGDHLGWAVAGVRPEEARTITLEQTPIRSRLIEPETKCCIRIGAEEGPGRSAPSVSRCRSRPDPRPLRAAPSNRPPSAWISIRYVVQNYELETMAPGGVTSCST